MKMGAGASAENGETYFCHQCHIHFPAPAALQPDDEVNCPACLGTFVERYETPPHHFNVGTPGEGVGMSFAARPSESQRLRALESVSLVYIVSLVLFLNVACRSVESMASFSYWEQIVFRPMVNTLRTMLEWMRKPKKKPL